ncbi:ferredoxin [Streptomyces sp. NBC_01020]|uniref:ferredoxin n=1 Tax=unclassified Streptomyces TaxID=2593676 RepID=UPI002E251ED4|nr:ferredoxin [Streptomyces sp. NBC_01020]WSX67448.1 ferredoxin [Streptomyces sp. NBC_00932]
MPLRREGGQRRVARVEVDLTRCAGYGHCVDAAPEVFRMSDVAEVAEVLRPRPGPELADSVREAARVCPANAVFLFKDGPPDPDGDGPPG